jgi:hypothetical protein
MEADRIAGERGIPMRTYSREEVLRRVGQNGQTLVFFPAFQDDDEVVRRAVTQNGIALQFASRRLRENRNIVLAAVSSNGYAFAWAGIQDLQIALIAIRDQNCGLMLQYATRELQDNEELVLAAVRSVPAAFEYASERLHRSEFFTDSLVRAHSDDRDVVYAVVRWRGYALQWASERFRDDPNIVGLAVSNNGNALALASPRLRDDEFIVRTAIRDNAYALQYASPRCQDNHDIVWQAIEGEPYALTFASDRLRGDQVMVQRVVRRDPSMLRVAADTLRGNVGFVRVLAATESMDVIEHATPEVQQELRNSMQQRAVEPARSNSLEVSRDDLTADPLFYLEQMAASGARVVIRFRGSVGQDMGGLTREFVTLLMRRLMDEPFVLPIERIAEGAILRVSKKRCPTLVARQISAYRSLGLMFGLALTGRRGILLGRHFHPILFTLLHSLTDQELAEVRTDLDPSHPICRKLMAVLVGQYLMNPPFALEPDQLDAQIAHLAEAAATQPAEFMRSYVMPQIRAALAIAVGIGAFLGSGQWQELKGDTSVDLSRRILGTSTRDGLKAVLDVYGDAAEIVRGFFGQWIDDASDEVLECFVLAATGTTGLPAQPGRITITVQQTASPRLAVLHTCSRSVELSLTHHYNYESFRDNLERSIDLALQSEIGIA